MDEEFKNAAAMVPNAIGPNELLELFPKEKEKWEKFLQESMDAFNRAHPGFTFGLTEPTRPEPGS